MNSEQIKEGSEMLVESKTREGTGEELGGEVSGQTPSFSNLDEKSKEVIYETNPLIKEEEKRQIS